VNRLPGNPGGENENLVIKEEVRRGAEAVILQNIGLIISVY
jgi:hypothetical protein